MSHQPCLLPLTPKPLPAGARALIPEDQSSSSPAESLDWPTGRARVVQPVLQAHSFNEGLASIMFRS